MYQYASFTLWLTQKIVSGFIEQYWKVQTPCFRIYYMHDLLRVLTFHVVYIVCILSKLIISAFSYGYGSVFKLKMVDITVGCKTSGHIHVNEYLISQVLLTKDSSTKLLPNLQDWPSTRFVYHCIIVFFLPFRQPVMFHKYGKITYQLISMKYLIRKDTENIEAAMPHTPICMMLKRNMCNQRKQGKAAAIKVILVSSCFTAGARFFVVYFQWSIELSYQISGIQFLTGDISHHPQWTS